MLIPTPTTEADAIALQLELRAHVVTDGVALDRPPRFVAGVDVAYRSEHTLDGPIAGAAVVIDLDDMSTVDAVAVGGTAPFPYRPGLLGFREVPILAEVLGKLGGVPDVVVCDGYGIAHPRRFGLACHLGLVVELPTFGVAKTSFVGTHGRVAAERGSGADLLDDHGTVVGRVVRTQDDVKPIFSSPGHLVDVATSAELTLRLSPAPGYRLPETTRRADRASRDALAAL